LIVGAVRLPHAGKLCSAAVSKFCRLSGVGLKNNRFPMGYRSENPTENVVWRRNCDIFGPGVAKKLQM